MHLRMLGIWIESWEATGYDLVVGVEDLARVEGSKQCIGERAALYILIELIRRSVSKHNVARLTTESSR